MSVSLKLEEKLVHLDQLMLDPNNYRLSYDSVDQHYDDDKVVEMQETIERKLAKEKLSDLIDSIVENGFLEVDRIVVRKLEGEEQRYLVVEGNRRTAALKSLYQDHQEGFLELSESLLDKMCSLSVLLINADDKEEIKEYQHTLMGVRHVSGPKRWTGMQSAKLVCDLFEQNHTATQIGSLLGISAIEANRRMRGYLAYRQLASDPKYREFAKSKHYALLLEFVSKKDVRVWLGWSDRNMITSKPAKEILYSHILKLPNQSQVEINNPTQAREFCKALSIPKFRKKLEKGIPLSKLGPITESVEEQEKEFSSFYAFLETLDPNLISSNNRKQLASIVSKIN